jgi:intracellular multiplication protein IcmP
MAAAPQQPGSPSEHSAAMLWWVAGIFAAIGGFWYVFKDSIIRFYLFLNFAGNYLGSYIHFPNFDQLRSMILYARASPKNIGFPDLMSIGNAVGDWLRIPLVFLLFVLAVVVYFGNATRVFKRAYSMHELAKLEKDNWPQIASVVNLDLIKTDIDTGPWAMAMTPMQFCKKYKLLEEVRPQRQEGMLRKEWDKVDVVLKRGETNKIFALQLGPLWKGTAQLPSHTKALFAAFAARINADTNAATNIFLQLNHSPANNLDLTGVDEVLKKHENTKAVQKIVQSHAYVLTVMASMLEAAREDGVQASADFLWLKPVDRRLWYTLNTVGRQTPFIEVGGVFAHWISEKEAGRRLLVPLVEEATNAVELALKEVLYRPDELNS